MRALFAAAIFASAVIAKKGKKGKKAKAEEDKVLSPEEWRPIKKWKALGPFLVGKTEYDVDPVVSHLEGIFKRAERVNGGKKSKNKEDDPVGFISSQRSVLKHYKTW